MLLERPGDVVTRQELRERLWPDIYVGFDRSLNTAVNTLRRALGDSRENPRFVETRSRRGYCFIAPVETEEAAAPAMAQPGERLGRTQTRSDKKTHRAAATLQGRLRSALLDGTRARGLGREGCSV